MECPDILSMLAHYSVSSPGSSWMLGLWLGPDATANQQQLKRLQVLLETYPQLPVFAVSVGNEAISRKDLSQHELISYIRKVGG
jgi:exo-beta-1,3-glucanase (GH17 family)